MTKIRKLTRPIKAKKDEVQVVIDAPKYKQRGLIKNLFAYDFRRYWFGATKIKGDTEDRPVCIVCVINGRRAAGLKKICDKLEVEILGVNNADKSEEP